MNGRPRSLALVLALACALAMGGSPQPARASHRSGPCALDRADGESVSTWVRQVIRCATDRWPVRGGARRAICVARAESGLDPKAVGDDGAYLGLYQHAADAWPDRYATWTRRAWHLDDRALNGRTNTVVTIRMVSANGWGPWRDVGDC